MSTAAVILIRRDGVPAELQEAACLGYCERNRYELDSISTDPDGAAALVETGVAQVIVAAYRRSEDKAIVRRIRTAGRVEYVRNPPGRQLDAVDLAVALHDRGASVEQIADLLGESTRDITATLSGQHHHRN